MAKRTMMVKNRLCNLRSMVTKRLVKGALLQCKRRPFTHQKMPFYIAKGHLLERKRA